MEEKFYVRKPKCFRKILPVFLSFILMFSLAQPAFAWGGKQSDLLHAAKLLDAQVLNPNSNAAADGKYLTYEGVHYDKTLAWALDEGFSKEVSQLIAESCYDVDSGQSFSDKNWHLGKSWFAEMDSWTKIKEWVYAKPAKINLSQETRINFALLYMKHAKDCVDRINNNISGEEKEKLLNLAYTYIGNGLHPLQDYFAHMNAGSQPSNLKWLEDVHHGEQGRIADLYMTSSSTQIKSDKVSIPMELLYDATNVDFKDNKWYLVENSGANTRMQKTDRATREYLREFKDYLDNKLREQAYLKAVILECSWAYYQGDDGRWYISLAQEGINGTVYSLGPIKNGSAGWWTVGENSSTYSTNNNTMAIKSGLSNNRDTKFYDVGLKQWLVDEQIVSDRKRIEGRTVDVKWYFFRAPNNIWYIVNLDTENPLIYKFSSKGNEYDWIPVDTKGYKSVFYTSNGKKYVRFL